MKNSIIKKAKRKIIFLKIVVGGLIVTIFSGLGLLLYLWAEPDPFITLSLPQKILLGILSISLILPDIFVSKYLDKVYLRVFAIENNCI